MQIEREILDELTSVINLTISPEDYEPEVITRIKHQQKQLAMPGFRKGHVPFGIAKKMYGDAFRGEEINRVASDNLFKFIADEKLDILGNPIPVEDEAMSWKEGEDLKLKFKIGLAPEVNVKFDENLPLDSYNISIDDETHSQTIANVQKQHSKKEDQSEITDDTIVDVIFKQVDAEGNEVENGISKYAEIVLSELKTDEAKDAFKNAKIDDTISIADIAEINNKESLEKILKTELDAYDELPTFLVEIKEWFIRVPAELNEELYNRLFPNMEIKTEEDFNNKIRESLTEEYQKVSNNFFSSMMQDKLLDVVKFDLPTEFLKEWMLETNENLDKETLEKQFHLYENDIRWQLIEKELAKQGEIKVSSDEIKEGVAQSYFGPQWKMSDNEEMNKSILNFVEDNIKKNPEIGDRMGRMLLFDKIRDYVKSVATINEIDVNAKEFEEIEKKYFEEKNKQ
ncbi:MAG: trigger factor [Lentimicrobiaceae bacterium]|nr:trigger factor [Lentimicrobiaceae bacterium]